MRQACPKLETACGEPAERQNRQSKEGKQYVSDQGDDHKCPSPSSSRVDNDRPRNRLTLLRCDADPVTPCGRQEASSSVGSQTVRSMRRLLKTPPAPARRSAAAGPSADQISPRERGPAIQRRSRP